MGVTGLKELDALINKFNKDAKVELIRVEEMTNHGFIPTGSPNLDIATCGGIPQGRVIEIFGQPSGGKTSLALQILKMVQQQRGDNVDIVDMIIDVERTITDKFVQGFGVQTHRPDGTRRVLIIRPDDVEQAFELCRDLPAKSGKIGLVIYDSIAASERSDDHNREVGTSRMGGVSKMVHELMRSIVGPADLKNITYIFLNQTTSSLDPYGEKIKSVGGNGLPFYSSLRLYIMKPSVSTSPGCFTMRVQVFKNKMGPPWGKDPIAITFKYGAGIDYISELIENATALGILSHNAGRSKILTPGGPEESEIISLDMEKGRQGCTQYIKTHPEVVERINKLLQMHLQHGFAIEATGQEDGYAVDE